MLPLPSCPRIGPGLSLALPRGRTLLHLARAVSLGAGAVPLPSARSGGGCLRAVLRDSGLRTCAWVLGGDLRAEFCSLRPALCPPAFNVLLPVLFVGAIPCLGLAVAAVASLPLPRCCSAVWHPQGPGRS